jgi:lipopolysaccharide export system protein LptA
MTRTWAVALLGIVVGVASWAQSGRPLELRSARQLNVRSIGGEEVRDFVGNVHFVQPADRGQAVYLWCDRALQYMQQGKIELTGNVRIVRDSITLRGPAGTYQTSSRSARMLSGVRLERVDGTTLTANEGYYEADARLARFYGNVIVVDSVSVTRSDTLIYYESGSHSIAMGRVSVVSPGDGVTVFGDSLVHYGDIGYTIVPRRPKMVHVDTVSPGRIDTLVVIGRVMEAYRDTTQQYVVQDSVLFARNELAGRSGYALYRPAEGLVVLLKNPVVWYGENQITGDSIAVMLQDQKLRSVFVAGKAMAVSRADSSLRDRYDQLIGRQVTLYFRDDNIERIEAVRNAISLYYLFEGTTPNGLNRSSGDRIIVEFSDGQVQDITVHGGVEGTYRPENLIVERERNFNLDGFRWHGNRPKRKGIDLVLE